MDTKRISMETSSVFSSWLVVLLLISVGELSYGQGPCNSFPCDNGGSCFEIGGGVAFVCACAPGFSGDTCTTNEAEERCEHNSCLNGATCTSLAGEIVCSCTSEYTGETCETQVDPCLPSPCQNGGTCEERMEDATCTCANGFMGDRCQTNVDPCSPNPCLNGGSCTRNLMAFSCTCQEGYNGDMCEMLVDPCSSNPCQNSGTCEANNGAFSCTCTAEFTGLICHMEDPTVSGPKSLAVWIIVSAVSVVVGLCAVFLCGVFVRSKRREHRNDSDTEKNCKNKESTAIYSRTIENIEDRENENSRKQQLQTYETVNNNGATVTGVASNAVKQEAMSRIATRDHMYLECEDSL